MGTPSVPPQSGRGAAPQVEGRSRLGVRPAALLPSAEAQGWTGLATTLRSEAWTAVERLPA